MLQRQLSIKKTVEKTPSFLDKGFEDDSKLEDFDSSNHSRQIEAELELQRSDRSKQSSKKKVVGRSKFAKPIDTAV